MSTPFSGWPAPIGKNFMLCSFKKFIHWQQSRLCVCVILECHEGWMKYLSRYRLRILEHIWTQWFWKFRENSIDSQQKEFFWMLLGSSRRIENYPSQYRLRNKGHVWSLSIRGFENLNENSILLLASSLREEVNWVIFLDIFCLSANREVWFFRD